MSSSISYEYLKSIEGSNNGLATLGNDGKIPLNQLPNSVLETYKGEYATSSALITAFSTANLADYAFVTATNSFWYWNKSLTTPTWVNQQITETDYLALSAYAKSVVPYIIVV